MKIIDRIHQWIEDRKQNELLKQHGGLQWCPWCHQCIQKYQSVMMPYSDDKTLDELICGNCRGTSVWLWAVGLIYMFPNHPPSPSKPEGNRNIKTHKVNIS